MLFFTVAVANLHSDQYLRRFPSSPVPLQHLLFVDFWYGHSDQIKVILLWIFDLHSFNIEWYWEISRVDFLSVWVKFVCWNLLFIILPYFEFLLAYLPHSLTYPRPLLEDRVISRLAGLGSDKCPSVISSKTVITWMATRWQDIFIPHWLLEPHLSTCCVFGL